MGISQIGPKGLSSFILRASLQGGMHHCCVSRMWYPLQDGRVHGLIAPGWDLEYIREIILRKQAVTVLSVLAVLRILDGARPTDGEHVLCSEPI